MAPSRHPARAALLTLVAVASSLAGLWTGGGDAAAAATCGPAALGRVAVVVVVDDGVRSPSVRCVEVPDRATGYDALIAAGHRLRIEAGFLCAIDGHPATGCANRPDFDGSYWRYFHAAPGGPWSYSNVGGGGYRMPPRCAIEGWRFSGAAGSNAAPRTPPPPVRCDAAPTTTAPRPAAPAPSPVPPPAPVPQRPAAPAPTPAAPGATSPPPADAGAGERAGADGRGGVDAASEDAPTSGGSGDGPSGAAGADDQDADTGGTDAAVDDGAGDGDLAGQEDADADVAGTTTSGSDGEERAAALDGSEARAAGSPTGVVVVGVLILGLVIASVVRARRRALGVDPVDPPGNA